MSFESRGELAGKHAVVTGGARGIGLAVATALARAGARVSVISRTVEGSSVRLGASESAAQAFATRADVTMEEHVIRAFDLCRAHNGPVAIVVNNSGIAESAPLLRTDVSMWKRILATNLTGTFLCAREAAKDMVAMKWGRIVNVSSTAGLEGAPYISAYSASKHGVVGFTRSIAAEFDGSGITANVICPGYTETDMMRRAMANVSKFTGASEEIARQRLAQSNPGGRIATVEEVADGVLDLVMGSRNGAALVIPGGTVL